MSWKHRDAKQEAREIRRLAEMTPYDQMVLLLPSKEHDFWSYTADYVTEDSTGWIIGPLDPWTAGYLKAKGATIKERS